MSVAYASIPGWWSTPEWYAARVREAPAVAHFVEVGSWQGRSACSAAEAIRDSGKVIRFDCVDTWQGTDPDADGGYHERLLADLDVPLRVAFERNLRAAGLWRYVNPVQADSVAAAALYEDVSLDGVMIDAEHTEGAVSADLAAWRPKVRPGGWIGGHDAQNPGVVTALDRAFGGAPMERHKDCWLYRLPASSKPLPRVYCGPPDWGSGDRWRAWIEEGFYRLGCEMQCDRRLATFSHFLTGAHRGQPIHIAALEIDGRRVWYDFSDFRQGYPDVAGLGETYFKIQALPEDGSQPIGQSIGEAKLYLEHVGEVQQARDRAPSADVVGFFANTDKTNLRLATVARLRAFAEAMGADVRVGLSRFNALRPEPPPELAAPKMTPLDHWRLQASSRIALALPGVEGDWTWRHTEVLGMGVPLLTLATEQRLPGNWRGCWAEVRRDLSDLEAKVAALLSDDEELERLGRLGRWYYEANLAPERMAARIGGCS